MVSTLREFAILLQNRDTSKAWLLACVLNKALHLHTPPFCLQESNIAGVIILERCKMDADSDGGNRYAFKLGESP